MPHATTGRPRGLGDLLRSDDDPPDRPEARRAAKDAVRRFFRAIAMGDMDALSAVITDDMVYEFPLSETGSTAPGGFRRYAGKAAVLALWAGTSGAGIKASPPEEVELTVTADGGRIVIEQRGNMVMADGREYRNRYVFRFDIRDGLVSHVKEYFNPVTAAYAFGRPVANGVMIEALGP